MDFHIPPLTRNQSGSERSVGFELEFAGVSGLQIASLITDLYGGVVREENRFLLQVEKTRIGTFHIELDARLLKNREYLGLLEAIGIQLTDHDDSTWLDDLMEDIATSIAVPWEIGAPPLPLSQLSELEKLRQGLLERNALGTKAKYLHAFGLHINIEAPSLSVEGILPMLRSFLVHYPWLMEVLEVDITRRLSTYIQSFPDEYFDLVLNPDYRPSMSRLIEDYLFHNPTRNRPLDLLPLFCKIDEALVRSLVDDGELIKPRPTFHYRLPNCLVDVPEWRLATEWNYWVKIEELADNPNQLEFTCRQLREEINQSPILWKSNWAEQFSAIHAP